MCACVCVCMCVCVCVCVCEELIADSVKILGVDVRFLA